MKLGVNRGLSASLCLWSRNNKTLCNDFPLNSGFTCETVRTTGFCVKAERRKNCWTWTRSTAENKRIKLVSPRIKIQKLDAIKLTRYDPTIKHPDFWKRIDSVNTIYNSNAQRCTKGGNIEFDCIRWSSNSGTRFRGWGCQVKSTQECGCVESSSALSIQGCCSPNAEFPKPKIESGLPNCQSKHKCSKFTT